MRERRRARPFQNRIAKRGTVEHRGEAIDRLGSRHTRMGVPARPEDPTFPLSLSTNTPAMAGSTRSGSRSVSSETKATPSAKPGASFAATSSASRVFRPRRDRPSSIRKRRHAGVARWSSRHHARVRSAASVSAAARIAAPDREVGSLHRGSHLPGASPRYRPFRSRLNFEQTP